MDNSAATEAVRSRYVYLVNHLNAKGVLPKLVEKELVDPDFYQNLQGKTRREQMQVLLTQIRRSPFPDWFDKFVQALEEGSPVYGTIAKELRKVYENVKKSPRPPIASQSSPGPPSPPGPSEGRPPVPSPSAPIPTVEASGTSYQDNQPSTRGQDYLSVPMDNTAAEKAVKSRYAYLVNHLNATDVLPELVEKGLVDMDFHENLQGKIQREQVQVLLPEILRSPVPDWFDKFAQALEERSPAHETIAGELRKEYENVKKSPRPPIASQSSPGPPSSPGPSEGQPPVPSPSAPNPTVEAGGANHQDDQPSTRGQEMNHQLQEATQSPAQPVKVAPDRPIKCRQGNIDNITGVSFAILVANENEYKAVLNYFGLGFTMVTSDQPYTDTVLNCTFDSDPLLAQNGAVKQKPAAGLTRCSDNYYSITINGKTGIIYRTQSIGSGGQQGAAVTTAQLLGNAKQHKWPLEIIFVVGCAGGHGEDVENGQVIVPTTVVEYNRGKREKGGQRMAPNLWPTSEKWRTKVTHILNRGDREKDRVITIAEVEYDYCADFVVKDRATADKLRTDSGRKMIGIEMEGVGVAQAIKGAAIQPSENVPEFLIVKGISDNADGNKGAPAPMLFFGKTYDAVYPDDRQVMAALQSVTLAVRAIHDRMDRKNQTATGP